MTDAPKSRRTHVIRVLGTNKSGDVLRHLWADFECMDEAHSVTQETGQWQGLVRQLRWLDDPDAADGVVEPRTRDGVAVGSGSRDVTSVKVCDPNETDLSDPEEWIPRDALRHVRLMRNSPQNNGTAQGIVLNHLNQELTDARIVEKRRVFHRDTSIDDRANAAFDADPTRRVFVVSGDEYSFVDGTEDRSQYVEHEVIRFLKARRNLHARTGAGDDQGKQTKLLNQYVVDQTDEAQLQEVGPQGFNPPYRLDPYQSMVNYYNKKNEEKIAVFAGNPAAASAMWFRVDKDSGLPVRYASKMVFSGFGQQTALASTAFLVQKQTNRGAFVLEVDDKGNVRLGARVLYNLDGSAQTTPVSVILDKDALMIPTFPDPPAKGKSLGGLFVTNSSLTKYSGAAIVWQMPNIFVAEMFVGRDGPGTVTVLGNGPDSEVDEEVFVVSVVDGSVLSRREIEFGLDPLFNTFARHFWDTSSKGDTFVTYGTGVKTFDITGTLKWQITFDPDGSGFGSAHHAIAVIEDVKQQNAYCLVADFSAVYGDVGGIGPTFQDHYVRILNVNSGSEMSRVIWSTSEFPYQIDGGAGPNTFVSGIIRDVDFSADSTLRFPNPPA